MRRLPCALLLLALGACPAPAAPAATTQGANLTLTGVTVRHARKGEAQLVAQTPRMTMQRFSADVTAVDAVVLMPASGAVVQASAVAGNLQQGVMRAQNAALRTTDGVLGLTAAVTFERDAAPGGLLHSPSPVKVTGPTFEQHASSFRYFLGDQRAEFADARTVVKGAP